MTVSGTVAHELVGSALLIAASVLALLAWYILRAQYRAMGSWNIFVRRKPHLGRALAFFMLLDAIVYLLLGLALIQSVEPIGIGGFVLVVLLAVAAVALFIIWAREEWT